MPRNGKQLGKLIRITSHRPRRTALYSLLLFAALVGHCAFWVGLVNRIHGIGIPRWIVDGVTHSSMVAFLAMPVVAACQLLLGHGPRFPGGSDGVAGPVGWYAAACVLVAIVWSGGRLASALHSERRGALLSVTSRVVDLFDKHGEELLAEGIPRKLGLLPGNQVLKPELTEKELRIPGLPAALDGLRIAHLSDFHMSGRIGREYFRDLVDITNEMTPDVVALTGDLVEFTPQLDWIGETLARFSAADGVYFVRGNHDDRCDHARMRRLLSEAGLVDLAGTWVDVKIRDQPVRFVGNELPWFGPAGDPAGEGAPVAATIALAHGPDQFRWAEQHRLNLLLAGHNHGGQIRLPIVGAVVTPSLHGTRYAGGVFRRGGTVMHVSRGVGSLAPLRFNCPPEFSLLTLRAASFDVKQ